MARFTLLILFAIVFAPAVSATPPYARLAGYNWNLANETVMVRVAGLRTREFFYNVDGLDTEISRKKERPPFPAFVVEILIILSLRRLPLPL